MGPPAERKTALRFAATVVAWLGCIFAWLCVLSFSPADPPSHDVWPTNDPPANLCGSVGAALSYHMFFYVGVGSYAVLALLTIGVAAWSRALRLSQLWWRFIGMALVCTVVSAWGALLLSPDDDHLLTGPGGALGGVVARYLEAHLRTAGTHILLLCAFCVGAILAAEALVVQILRGLGWTGRQSAPIIARGGVAMATAGRAIAVSVADFSGRIGGNGRYVDEEAEAAPNKKTRRERAAASQQLTFDEPSGAEEEPFAEVPAAGLPQPAASLEAEDEDEEDEDEEVAETAAPAVSAAPAVKSTPAVRAPEEAGPPAARARPRRAPGLPAAADDQSYALPSVTLLEAGVPLDRAAIESLCREKAYILEQTLNEFRVGVQVAAIDTGPVITVFELKLAPGVKVSQIASLTNDLARALKAPAVRVVAPLPGKNTIGIEVPNVDKERVRLRDVIETFGARAASLPLPLFMGKDASGAPLVSDLTRMPHLLIAGTTGSGKSVCVSSLILSILLARSPSEVNLILVDPKMVELSMFKDIPHLLCPIITDATKAESILDWAATLMDERYALLAEAGVRDIRGYNRLGAAGLKERLQIEDDEELARIPIQLPYLVLVIDELADLMMTSAKEVEFNLCRLAQKSRAVGIHLIVSTQRPQANVVTGLIKSNLPCRICFRVSSRLDSRIVLDQNGGEALMGQGDMLFLAPGTSKLLRAQGTFVSDEELRAVVLHCKAQRQPTYHPELVRMPGDGDGAAAERDELFDQAVDIIIESGRGSVSLLQRRLTVGYGRASRLIDQMYVAGIVGEYKGSQAREVLLTKEEWQAARSQRDREMAEEEERDGEVEGEEEEEEAESPLE